MGIKKEKTKLDFYFYVDINVYLTMSALISFYRQRLRETKYQVVYRYM